MRKYTPEDQIKAFWNKVNKNGSIPEHCSELGPCWEWLNSCDKNGYGHFNKYRSHRYSWLITYGEIPNNLWVLHKCDNPSCVNPSHLFLGTRHDNIKDMIVKERQSSDKARLTRGEVLEIRDRYSKGDITHADLCIEYQVSRITINRIIQHKTWKQI